jgi:hypothetical protein
LIPSSNHRPLSKPTCQTSYRIATIPIATHRIQLESHSTSIKTQLSNIDPGIAALVDTAVALEDSLDGAGDEDAAEDPVSGCLAWNVE